MTIGGQAAVIAYISPNQVNAQVPMGAGIGPQQITVTTAAGTSTPYALTVKTAQPGLLAPASFTIGGKRYVEAMFTGSTDHVLPSGGIPGTVARPARPGETITLYGIGFGAMLPRAGAGEVVQESTALNMPVQIFFGQNAATVSYSGLVAGALGLYQIDVVVPNMTDGDAVPLTLTQGGITGEQTLYTAVRN